MGMINDTYTGYTDARCTLHVVEPYGEPTIERIAARYLARRGRH